MAQKDSIDEQLKQLLNGLEAQPDMRSFDAVLRKIERRKRRRFILFFTGSSVFLLAFLALALGLPETQAGKPLPSGRISLSPVGPSAPSDSMGSHSAEPGRENNGTSTAPVQKQADISPGVQPSMLHAQGPAHKLPAQETQASRFNAPRSTLRFPRTTVNSQLSTFNSPPLQASFSSRRSQHGIPSDEKPAEAGHAALPTVSDEQARAQGLSENFTEEPILFLPPLRFVLFDTNQPKLLPAPYILLQPGAGPDSLSSKKKSACHYYLGINFNPQYSSFLFSKNKHSTLPDTADFANLYTKDRSKHTVFRFNYSYGFKLGLVLHERYEFLLGLGFQRYIAKEQPYSSFPGPSPGPIQNTNEAYDAMSHGGYINNFHYAYYSLEVHKRILVNRFLGFKAGAGFQVNRLRSAAGIYVNSHDNFNYGYAYFQNPLSYSRWTYTGSISCGLIARLGKRFEFQLAPALFYSPASLFNKTYVIKQKPYGIQMQGILLFRLF